MFLNKKIGVLKCRKLKKLQIKKNNKEIDFNYKKFSSFLELIK